MSIDFDASLDSEPEVDPVEDGDTVDNIQKYFQLNFIQSHQESVALKKKYIKYAANSSDFSKISIGLDNEMQVYDVTPTGLSKYVGKNDFGKFDQNVSDLRFFRDDQNMLLASTISGEIHLYDLRTFSRVHTFEDDTEVIVKPVSCFDVNSENHYICAGSEEFNHEVYLMFYDVRERRYMGGFFESHQEEVTGELNRNFKKTKIQSKSFRHQIPSNQVKHPS